MFNYEKTNRYFAQFAGGMEELAHKELSRLGAANIKTTYRGLYFDADKPTLYRVNYSSKIITRVLGQLLRFDCHSVKYLYITGKKIDWQRLIKPGKTFAINAICENSKINHSHYAMQRLKDAVADYFVEKTGSRPDVDRRDPDVGLHLHIQNNKATISLDTSGGSLHRRGYRKGSVEAPMQETLAAAIIALTGWDGKKRLVDPMCGSGTLLSEALMHYCRIPPGYLRQRFGFESMPDFAPKIWEKVKQEADKNIRTLPDGLISGSDMAAKSVAAAKKNLAVLPEGPKVAIKKARFQELGRLDNAVIVCNPPYGIRLGEKKEVAKLLKEFGDFLKRNCKNSSVFLYLGDKELLKKVGLKPKWKKQLKSGPLEGVLARYDIY